MGSRTTLLAVVAALLLSAPAHAQDPPAGLFEPAPAEAAGAVNPTDGGRSTLLLGIALVTVAGAGLLLGLAVRPRRRTRAAEPEAPAPTAAADPPAAAAAPAPGPAVTASHPVEAPTRARRFRPTSEAPKRPRRFRAARATAAEASASARMGMPVFFVDEPEPEPELPVWRPRVHSDLPPLPAFGSEQPPEEP